LQKNSSRRRINVEMNFNHDGDDVRLTVRDEDSNSAEVIGETPYQESQNPSLAREQIEKQLSSTGNTSFKVMKLNISLRAGFYSLSFLNSIKRNVLAELAKCRLEHYSRETTEHVPNSIPYPEKRLDYHANVFNEHARRFYQRHGAEVLEPAFETIEETAGREVMKTRYCLRYELDACPKSDRSRRQLKEPLRISDGHHHYLLKFDCDACRMSLIFSGKI